MTWHRGLGKRLGHNLGKEAWTQPWKRGLAYKPLTQTLGKNLGKEAWHRGLGKNLGKEAWVRISGKKLGHNLGNGGY
jgi:hypothetical protein